ncbi:hypothetical protein [Bradyrhizobium sp. STM 3843]|uniref:hypothetical protein n=1 Tax=unclassified Bradyrhizobium TaxID=2631580 RepID=UPI0005676235|nr:hypothetical protein [Bradyrhizobium sp. STM 3843]
MNDIVEAILHSSGVSSELARTRLKLYLDLLASTGKRDEQALASLGAAYIKEMLEPDPRYTGC